MSVALALILLLQNETPEAILKKIESSIAEAETFRAVFTIVGRGERDPAGDSMRFSGTLQMKKGNKLNLNMKGFDHRHEGRTEARPFSIVSDGSRVKSPHSRITKRCPDNYGPWSAKLFARGGANLLASFGVVKPSRREKYEKRVEVRDLRTGDTDGEASTLLYRIPGWRGSAGEYRLWFNSQSLQLLKRTFTLKRDGAVVWEMTETYEAFVKDGEIPDKQFQLPPRGAALAVYPETDVMKLTELKLKNETDVEKDKGLLKRGVLEFEGSGELGDIFFEYVAEMKKRGWRQDSSSGSGNRASALLFKDTRRCTLTFTKNADTVTARVEVGPRE